MYISFEEPQSAITEGQFAAWYLDDELVGSELFLSLVL
jgi:tRNA-specific 2-thiouridylase